MKKLWNGILQLVREWLATYANHWGESGNDLHSTPKWGLIGIKHVLDWQNVTWFINAD